MKVCQTCGYMFTDRDSENEKCPRCRTRRKEKVAGNNAGKSEPINYKCNHCGKSDVTAIEQIAQYVNVYCNCCKKRSKLQYIPDVIRKAVIHIESEDGRSTAFYAGNGGLLLTCAHCVDVSGCTRYRYGRNNIDLKVLYSDNDQDIAVLKQADGDFFFDAGLPFAEENKPKKELFAYGFDVDENDIRFQDGTSIGNYCENEKVFSLMTNKIRCGYSGGPVLDIDNRIVGMNRGKQREDSTETVYIPLEELIRAISVASTLKKNEIMIDGNIILRKSE